ncbi:interactor of constitutive active ROPs 2, chloroplastic-like isoform X2 [Chenopodium quinoa]|uniref:interactor of constitutive active ROPs 2, chloroplastic-like isoform X2 n=1 Tax=Chenopodium quinoa TaxID=63459 RepID=UPI000B7797D8|nr:interactor of constitutive active ROPs 2, chloroplastic-like isoform X2 [Chenopodium quinoa]
MSDQLKFLARLRDMVKQLLYEKDSYIQRQADLELKMKQLQTESDSWHEKEVSLEQRISQLLQENASLSFEQRNLLEKYQHVEKEKHSLVETENLDKEMIMTLNSENAKLKMQVLELEGARNSLSQDKQQLLDNISNLQSRVHNLEMSLATPVPPTDAQKDASEKESLNTEMEEMYALIGKLMAENADLVEKVNQMSMVLGQRAVVPDITSVDIPDYSSANPLSRSTEDIQEDNSLSTKSFESFGTAPVKDEQRVTDELNSEHANIVRHSSETSLTGEIVQISLDENESQDIEAQASVGVEDESVPLADAPLIGAPFRLISFVTNYVSGADLVNKGPSNSLQ